MGGEGSMQHGVTTNKYHRAQQQDRHERHFNIHAENFDSRKQIVKLDFSHLTPQQIETERQRIKVVYAKRKRKDLLTVIIIVSIIIILSLILIFK